MSASTDTVLKLTRRVRARNDEIRRLKAQLAYARRKVLLEASEACQAEVDEQENAAVWSEKHGDTESAAFIRKIASGARNCKFLLMRLAEKAPKKRRAK